MTSTHPNAAEQTLRRRIGRFFYEPEVPYGMALVRILLPLVLLIPMVPRWPVARELYSLDGAPSPLWVTYGWHGFLPLFPGTVVVAMHTALLFFLVASAVGWKTRFSLIASTILYTYLNLCDSMGTITKYSVIASHVLLLLSMSQCGAIWSVDAWLKRRRNESGPGAARGRPPRFPAWPRRLCQLLIGIVYFGAAVTKMHTPAFFSGEQLQTWLLSNVNYKNPVGEYLALYPAVVVVFAYIVIVWEVLFVFLGWRGWGRTSMLGLGVVFHFMTTLTLGLYVFPLVCLSTYFSFVNEDDVRKWGVTVRRIGRRLGLPRAPLQSLQWPSGLAVPPALRFPSTMLYAVAAVGITVVGIEIEYQRDLYGQRRPEGPYTLKEIDADVVAKMIGPPKPLRLKDMFDTFQIGTDLVGGTLLGRRNEFQQGEVAIAQVSFNAPHHDLWVECNLHDERGNLVDRLGQVVSREMYRANFPYHLSHLLEPGQYDLVLKSAGREIMRRRITLKPGAKGPVAN